jgi:hypothetical protein
MKGIHFSVCRFNREIDESERELQKRMIGVYAASLRTGTVSEMQL